MSTQLKHQCAHCTKYFKKKSTLSDHVKCIHSDTRDHKCTQCDYECKLKSALTRHIRDVHQKIKLHACSNCTKSFSSTRGLTRHVNAMHLKLKPFGCTYCDKKFAYSYNIQKHIDAVHLKLKTYKCDTCTYSTSDKSLLKRHTQERHLGIRYNCEYCEYKATQKAYLKLHVSSVHLKSKPYKCDKCDYTCALKSTLVRQHQVQHTNDFNHICKECGMNFRLANGLSSHIKNRHSGNLITYIKKEEKRIYDLLELEKIAFDYDKKIILPGDNKKTARLDFMIQINNTILIVEVDEHGHRNLNLSVNKDDSKCGPYSVSCEQTRMVDIVSGIRLTGEKRAIGFIRYNPHPYTIDGKKYDTHPDDREEMLLDVIKYWNPTHDLNIQYMYYDTYRLDFELRCCIWDHKDYETNLLQYCVEPII